MSKLFSGRYFWAVISALVFLGATISGILTGEQVFAILAIVVGFYFSIDKQKENGK